MLYNIAPPPILPNALPFTRDGQVTVPLAVDTNWTNIFSYSSEGYRTYVTGYGITVRDNTYTFNGSLIFRILLNGGPIQDGTPNGIFSGERGSVANPIPCLIFVENNTTFSIQVRRAIAAAGTTVVAALALGFRYPPEVRKDPIVAQNFKPDAIGRRI